MKRRPAPALLLTALALGACAHRPQGAVSLGPEAAVTLADTLPDFLSMLRAPPAGDLRAGWLAYEQRHASDLGVGDALTAGGEAQLGKLVASADALERLAVAFESSAPAELNAVVTDLTQRLQVTPRAAVAFGVLRTADPVRSASGPTRRLVFNARSPELAQSEARRARFTRALFLAWHEEREPPTESLGPLAWRLFREGGASLAARQLAPKALEHQVLGLSEAQLSRVRAREALAAKELLAAFDSAREVEAARFFDAAVSDPLVPELSGLYLADRVFQRLVEVLGSPSRPLALTASEFRSLARKQLEALAAGH